MMNLFDMAPTFDNPLGMLRACHRRIERALTVMERLAEQEAAGALDEPARDALRQMLHYFAVGVPRHSADEEESLFPRLRAAQTSAGECLPDAAALRLLHTLEQEHAEADAAHHGLDALGQGLLRTGQFEAPEERARFAALIAALRQLYQEHIRAEDDELFPLAARTLGTADQETVGLEMAARRGIDWHQQREVVAQLESHPWSLRAPARGAATGAGSE